MGNPKIEFSFELPRIRPLSPPHPPHLAPPGPLGYQTSVPGSWLSALSKTPGIHEKISYSQFRKRLARAAFAVSKGKKRTDICAVCKQWDGTVKRRIDAAIDKPMTMLADLCADYFDKLPRVPGDDAVTFERASSVTFIQTLLGL